MSLARQFGAKVFAEPWKGFARQKNSALEKATCDWILSLDADEEVSPELAASIKALLTSGTPQFAGYLMNRRNMYFGKWIKRSGYYPDPKLRLIRRGAAAFELRDVHEDMKMAGELGRLKGDMIHHAYPTLESFIEHANRYSSLGADMVARERKVGFSVVNIVFRPLVRFIWALFFSRRLSGRPRRPAGADEPRGVCELEVCQGVGEIEKLKSHHGGAETRRKPGAMENCIGQKDDLSLYFIVDFCRLVREAC